MTSQAPAPIPTDPGQTGWFSTLLIGALLFVWSLPHTIALRYTLMLGVTVCFARPAWQCLREHRPMLRWPLILFASLTLWIMLQATLISPEPAWAWGEIRGQWFKSVLLLVVGMGVGHACLRDARRRQWLLSILTATLLLQVLVTVADAIYFYAQHGAWAMGQARLNGSRTLISYVTNLLLAFLVTDLLQHLNRRPRLLGWPLWLVLLSLGAALFCTWTLQTRNGTLGLLGMLGMVGLLQWYEHRRRPRIHLIVALCALALAGLTWVLIQSDPRWAKFQESAVIAWDTQTHKKWLDFDAHPYPKLSNGEDVDGSAYLRIAWIKEASLQILAHPLGVGYGRNAFGHALRSTYGMGAGHSHSGILDLTLGIGIPGLLLWLAWLGALLHTGWRAYGRSHQGYPLVLAFLVTGFFGRSLLDGNIRDHMLEQFVFLVSLFSVLSLASQPKPSSPAATDPKHTAPTPPAETAP